ncbi:hypothetical protein SAMN05880590_10488 [Rhizobium sp. RU35A]|uniref:chlorophyllide reductase n=1 Tax=Rhizobium sp. RU35A TaxID=1907414 RepID=UPI0009544A0D|nr:chlorophyllide reductase [Rhizobium sp. RU35A]SIQ43399.1 hypothetical protein SAMN05880590_10488 [Rhizobium sp. RU35A]
MSRIIPLTIAVFASCLVLVPAHAAPSTSKGSISVAQVSQMLKEAPTNRMAQQVLTAYLGGVGEAAGIMVDLGGAPCKRPFTLTAEDVRRTMDTAPAGTPASEVAATPLLVRDMLARAGCHSR